MIERVVDRVRGRGRRTEPDERSHREQLLELCGLVQHAAHVWGPYTDEPLCIQPFIVDDVWRAVLVLVRDSPPSKDDGLYRYAMENLKHMAEATLRHAAAARAAHQETHQGADWTDEQRDTPLDLPPALS